jgi:hypothetical protein
MYEIGAVAKGTAVAIRTTMVAIASAAAVTAAIAGITMLIGKLVEAHQAYKALHTISAQGIEDIKSLAQPTGGPVGFAQGSDMQRALIEVNEEFKKTGRSANELWNLLQIYMET